MKKGVAILLVFVVAFCHALAGHAQAAERRKTPAQGTQNPEKTQKEEQDMLQEIGHLPMNPSLEGQAELLQHIAYSQNGQELSLILPWANAWHLNKKPAPLIVFVQGSSWTTPDLGFEIPMLSHFAEAGFVVATVSHRSAEKGYPFPAFLVDVKCAIRFLRAHASEYGIDPTRVLAFGTSSGGNTVCLLGLTGDDPEFRTDEYANESDAVSAVVACFAPTNLVTLFEYLKDYPDATRILTAYFGPDAENWPERMRAYSPVYRVEDGKEYPPFLLLHGTGDTLVPSTQTEELYVRLREAGAQVQAYYVDGAEHEGNFWSPEVRAVIQEEIIARLGRD